MATLHSSPETLQKRVVTPDGREIKLAVTAPLRNHALSYFQQLPTRKERRAALRATLKNLKKHAKEHKKALENK
jgi:hypothetical protein